MAVLEMEKVEILSYKEHKDALLHCLKESQIIELRTPSKTSLPQKLLEQISHYELQLGEIKAAIHFIENLQAKKKGFIDSFLPPKEMVSEEDFQKAYREFDFQKTIQAVEHLETVITHLKNQLTELDNECHKLLPWQTLETRLNLLGSCSKTCFITGKTKNKQLATSKHKLEKFSSAFELIVVSQTKEEAFLVLICLAGEAKTFMDYLSKLDFTLLPLPTTPRTPKEELTHLHQARKELEIEIQKQMEAAKALSVSLSRLKYVYDYILEQKNNLETKQNLLDTQYTFVVQGWIKKQDLPRLKHKLAKVTDQFEIFSIQPEEGDAPPVALHNPAILSPFELITKIYALPKPGEPDPTLPLAFFFTLFFGLCLGDFVYGVVLSLISIYFLKRYRLPQGGANLFKLLFIGGLTAALVGALTGSYLGYTPAELAFLGEKQAWLSRLQIIDPVKDPLIMLGFSLALGIAQILFGFILALGNKIKNKQYFSAIADDGLWLLFLISLVLLIIAPLLPWHIGFPISYVSATTALLLVLTQGRHKKNILQKFFSGLLSLYRVSGYMGDTLSYSRLLALGMSTTIIGAVLNILANMAKNGLPGVGIIFMILILVVGHLFNLTIGVLGAFVHSARLQLVEFFSKFYEGGGKEFKPFQRIAEYTIIE